MLPVSFPRRMMHLRRGEWFEPRRRPVCFDSILSSIRHAVSDGPQALEFWGRFVDDPPIARCASLSRNGHAFGSDALFVPFDFELRRVALCLH